MAKSIKPAPNPEVGAKPKRRRFTAAYKAKVLEECDAATEPGEIGAILRREGLYSSHLFQWRRARHEKGLAGLAEKKRGPKAKSELARENGELRQALAKAEERARRAELIVGAQKALRGTGYLRGAALVHGSQTHRDSPMRHKPSGLCRE